MTKFEDIVPVLMKRLMDEFEFTDYQALGPVGNIAHECNGFQNLREIGQPEGKGGYGWAQWTGPRAKTFLRFCHAHGLSWSSPQANLDFLVAELRSTQSDAVASVLKCKTVNAAVIAFERTFERAGVPRMESRQAWAHKAEIVWRDFNEPSVQGELIS